MSTIELLPEQQLALDSPEPVRAVDPRTNTSYVLIREETYERLRRLAYDDSPWTDEELELLAWESGKLAGWNGMDEYDRYEKKP